jgi:phosphoadenosine phosphosulfate reductase
MLEEHTLFGKWDKVQIAIERLKTFEPIEGYYLAFSGGKDSCVLKDIAIRAGVKFTCHYSVTAIDPPDLIRFIKQYHKGTKFERKSPNMLHRMIVKGYPTRQVRWCCEYLKEKAGSGRTVLTGIRWAESPRRKLRKMVEGCMTDKSKRFIHPIIDWTDEDVWEYHRRYGLPYCKLYDEGWIRLGCLMCPMVENDKRANEAARYPQYARVFRIFFRRMHARMVDRDREHYKNFKDGDELFNWWLYEMGKNKKKEDSSQMSLFDCG